jgi:hypothetical protein
MHPTCPTKRAYVEPNCPQPRRTSPWSSWQGAPNDARPHHVKRYLPGYPTLFANPLVCSVQRPTVKWQHVTWRAAYGGPSLVDDEAEAGDKGRRLLGGRGLHSSTFQLNLNRSGHHLVSPCLIDWGETVHPTYPTRGAYIELTSERV